MGQGGLPVAELREAQACVVISGRRIVTGGELTGDAIVERDRSLQRPASSSALARLKSSSRVVTFEGVVSLRVVLGHDAQRLHLHHLVGRRGLACVATGAGGCEGQTEQDQGLRGVFVIVHLRDAFSRERFWVFGRNRSVTV